MLTFLTSAVGLAGMALYFYTALMFGRTSYKAGNGFWHVVWDAMTWPVFGWAAIEKLAKNPPA